MKYWSGMMRPPLVLEELYWDFWSQYSPRRKPCISKSSLN